eukprot:CAMPEP_0170086190 /NCGR_PEP_ID=MMETSP0019_2-20121128/20913_1 /TAXON_ID=98059 /ORGANISM="Dinobryon sp., Strain UTEXLB2267" /LENGTH=87 /DNA_ID=CAMNT_0010303083 /DNA_START=126 /DNA_END=390 /DNA_ORIENTATION=+
MSRSVHLAWSSSDSSASTKPLSCGDGGSALSGSAAGPAASSAAGHGPHWPAAAVVVERRIARGAAGRPPCAALVRAVSADSAGSAQV